MIKTSKTILFFGTEEFSATVLESLVVAGFAVAAVITKPDAPRGRGQQLLPPHVKQIAEAYGIRVLQPERLADITDIIAEYDHPTGVLASYGKIIPESILALFEPGIINVHPSLLPKYRGATPIESTILNGDDEAGVSIMKLVAAMDAGPVYTQQNLPLRGDETAEQLYSSLAHLGSELLIQHLPFIINGELQPVQQDNARATYTAKIEKKDGIIDWHTPAIQIERRIRAYHEWPQSRTTLGSTEVIITKAHVVDDTVEPGKLQASSTSLLVGTSRGSLAIDSLKPLGKKEMPVGAFLQGYHL